MERALVVVDESDRHRELLREAGELAAGVGAELVLLSATTEEEYENDLETIEAVANVENIGFGRETIVDAAKSLAKAIAQDELDDLDVEYDVVGEVVDENGHADAALRLAADRDCDHIFVAGRQRSPTGKAIFGDVAQSVILNFDGPVTVLTG